MIPRLLEYVDGLHDEILDTRQAILAEHSYSRLADCVHMLQCQMHTLKAEMEFASEEGKRVLRNEIKDLMDEKNNASRRRTG